MLNRTTRFAALLIVVASLSLHPNFMQPALGATITEAEPNDTAETAQTLPQIGLQSPLTAAIGSPGDRDWYRFSATAGRTYVVELFDVANTLGGNGRACFDASGGATGVSLFAFGPALGNPIVGNCNAINSAGNVHSSVQITAGVSGAFHIRIFANSSSQSGAYNLRILPQFDEAGTGWDTTTYEPNNQAANAYSITAGRASGLSASVEGRSTAFSTFFSDIDWYRFEAESGKTYAVELFNVSNTLGGNGRACFDASGGATGVSLFVFGPSLGPPLVGRCGATNSAGNVHSSFQFTAGVAGSYFIRVFPNNSGDAGTYSLRILPKFEEPGATWNTTTFEPNNQAVNAYQLVPGRENALTTSIEERSAAFGTSFSDIDWYRFNTTAGRTYVVELFDVANTLNGTGTACDRKPFPASVSTGLTLFTYSPTLGLPAAGSCGATERSGNVHSRAQFTAGVSGIYYIRVYPNNITQTGTYSLRVCAETCTERIYLPLLRR